MIKQRERRLRTDIEHVLVTEFGEADTGVAQAVYKDMAQAIYEGMEQMVDNQELRTAYHEAGHAVAFLALGIRFRVVSIVPSDGADGRVDISAHMRRVLRALKRHGLTPEIRQTILNHLIGCYAGEAGLALCPVGLERQGNNGHEHDFEDAQQLAEGLSDCEDEQDSILRRAQAQAVNLITFHAQNAVMVKQLARALLKQGTLTYKQVQALFE